MRVVVVLAVVSAALGALACDDDDKTDCAPGLYLMEGRCMDGSTQNYVSCVYTRGQNLTEEEQRRLDASVTGALRGVTGINGVYEVTTRVIETELPEATAEILRACWELSKRLGPPDDVRERMDELLEELGRGTIEIEPQSGRIDQVVRVVGTGFPANEELEIATLWYKVRVTTDAEGNYEGSIQIGDPEFQDLTNTVDVRVRVVDPAWQSEESAVYTVTD
jgi:hypothetical protein